MKDHIFLSNRNHIKGLEFPFVICVTTKKISTSKTLRNALYMIMSRSFISSHLIFTDAIDDEAFENLSKSLTEIRDTNRILIKEPTEEEKITLSEEIISTDFLIQSNEEKTETIMNTLSIPKNMRRKIHDALKGILSFDADEDIIEDSILSIKKLIEDTTIWKKYL